MLLVIRENIMRHPISKITKMVRNLASEAYEELFDTRPGFMTMRADYEDGHGLGCFRSVILREGVAIKLVRSDRYIDMNRAEWDMWLKLPPSLRVITAKPLCISNCGRVMAVELVPQTLAQDYYANNRDHYETDLREFNSDLRVLLQDSGLFDETQIRHLMMDNHANNVGVRENGELCWIDYAGA
jgi:hypothetical protein